MFDTIKRMREKNAQLLCGSAIILALGISGCTTSGTPLLADPSLLEGVASDAALVESKTGQSSTDNATVTAQPVIASEQILAATAKTTAETTAAAAQAEKPVLPSSEKAVPAETAIAATNQIVQPTEAAAPAGQPTMLAALFGTRNKPTAALAVIPATETSQTKQPQNTAATQAETPPETVKTETTTKPAAPNTSPALDRTSQSAGAAARLFSSGRNSTRGEATGTQQPATIAALPQKKTSDYNFTLPGVRANGGVEIRHSNKVFDESDIDLDEDDFSAPVTLASAGGMARLAPNGLRTQHDKVQVSCLKPQLVAMIKRLESQYRKPAIITSGYRSPAHNRSVSGAKRSMHMSCSAADLQIPGISKWEIARQVRSWRGRGGVGTYCRTESVHIDIGPERDWNWNCRRS